MIVHSKVSVIDDRLMRVGSTNLNNRSLGFDTECDIAASAEDAADRTAVRVLRDRLIGQGGRIIAPCPHDRECPLVEPDWCHFSVRLNRSREHMRMKGGTLGYEDEKYSYLVVARPGIGVRATGRVIRQPAENKFSVTVPVCAIDGLEQRVVASRDNAAFKAARKLAWGDAIG